MFRRLVLLLLLSECRYSLCLDLSEWKSRMSASSRCLGVSATEHLGRLGRTLRTTGVAGRQVHRDDSLIVLDERGYPELTSGLSKEVWGAVEMYSGIALNLSRVASTWGGRNVSSKREKEAWKHGFFAT